MADTGGCVTLVGAGPGDPGLLTLAGLRALTGAEVVLYDRLASEDVLALAPGRAEKINVGKNKGDHPVPQEEINRLLLRYALAGKKVVRLKGGDPFLFGRGLEELEPLRRAGVPFRVVPGVSSALAAPAYAGIPMTHRDCASSVHIVAGHGRDGRAPSIPYAQLARLDGTLVFLMALSSAAAIRDGLLGAGMDPGVPAAAIEKGTTPAQRVLVATLGDLPERLEAAGFAAPTVIVIGRVAALAGRFAWVDRLPLWGRRVLAVSSRTLGGRLAPRLRDMGCRVDEFAGIEREALPLGDAFWTGLEKYAWIVFASAFAADMFFDRLAERRIDVRRLAGSKFAAVGAMTAKALAGRGVFADFVPEAYNAGSLAAGLLRTARPGETALLFKAEGGTPELAALLRAGGIVCDEAAAYRTRINPGDQALRGRVLGGEYDAATFASASSVAAFAALLDGADCPRLEAICIGGTAAAAARELGLVPLVSPEATVESMADKTLELLRRMPEEPA